MTNRQKAYRKYLLTDHWKNLRELALVRDNHQCVECGDTDNIQVHHLRYRSKWEDTPLVDLKTLCRTCHRFEHGLWVKLPIDDIEQRIRLAIAYGKRPAKEDWIALRNEGQSEYVLELLGRLLLQYCLMIGKPVRVCLDVRDFTLCKCRRFVHLKKDCAWQRRVAKLIEKQKAANLPR